MSQKHGRPSVVAGHCGLSAVHLRSMVGPLLLSPLSKCRPGPMVEKVVGLINIHDYVRKTAGT